MNDDRKYLNARKRKEAREATYSIAVYVSLFRNVFGSGRATRYVQKRSLSKAHLSCEGDRNDSSALCMLGHARGSPTIPTVTLATLLRGFVSSEQGIEHYNKC